MSHVQMSFRSGHAQSGENPELRALFYRLAMLTAYPVHLIFVADGARRPKLKRGKHVKTAPHWLTEGMRQFVEAFGCCWFEVREFLSYLPLAVHEGWVGRR